MMLFPLMIAGFFVNAARAEHHSSHMRGFAIQQCHHGSCVRATGPLAFVSLGGSAISSSNARLELFNRGHKTRALICHDLRFEIPTGFLLCDNSETSGSVSLSVDRDLNVNEYRK